MPAVSGVITAGEYSKRFQTTHGRGVNIACHGDLSNTPFRPHVLVERSIDGGANFMRVDSSGLSEGGSMAFLGTSYLIDEPQVGAFYRLKVPDGATGSCNYTIGH